MTKKLNIFKCEVCGNIVEVVHEAGGVLTCCKQAMALNKENTKDAAKEKHIPALKRDGSTLTVKVGDIPHPMEEKHYIEWVELIEDGKTQRIELKPNSNPEVVFNNVGSGNITVRAYCNLHGLWKA